MNKEVFERWTKAINYHYIEAGLSAKPMHMRDANPSVQLLVDKDLVL